MVAIAVLYQGFERPEPPAAWVPMGYVKGFGDFVPWEVEKTLQGLGYDPGMVQHALYVVPEDDYVYDEAVRHQRHGGVVRVIDDVFPCEPELVQAVREAAIDRDWEKPPAS
jgi:uncharacterized membrane protein YqaE (UPF0057 family)